MRVIVAGGRNVATVKQNVLAAITELRNLGATVVLSGCCSGADIVGEMAAARLGLRVEPYAADWKRHGRSAGPIRNRKMAEHADACILFPGGSGTASMRREAVAHGLRIVEIEAAAFVVSADAVRRATKARIESAVEA